MLMIAVPDEEFLLQFAVNGVFLVPDGVNIYGSRGGPFEGIGSV